MNKEFIPYEQALALKKLGFDEQCFGIYEIQDKLLVIDYNNKPLTEEQQKRPTMYIPNNRNSVLPQWAISAPLYQQVFRWFREKGWELFIMRINEGFYTLSSPIFPSSILYKTYEEAEIDCLNKLIELVKEKKS